MFIEKILITMFHVLYWFLAFNLSIYYAVRGIIYNRYYRDKVNATTNWKYIIVGDIQEGLFQFITTISSFFALAIAYGIFKTIEDFSKITSGTSALLVSLALWGIIGIGGWLTEIILRTKNLIKLP